MTLLENVLKRHVEQPDHSGPYCPRDGQAWPCDAYRLAVMVRDIEALASSGAFTIKYQDYDQDGPHMDETDPVVYAARILAITRGVSP